MTICVKYRPYLCSDTENKMRTFILQWRPAASDYSEGDFLADIGHMEFGDFSWTIGAHGEAGSGDNFYMVKSGEGRTGIVMKGFFTSDPYRGDDWSDRDRNTWFVNIRPTFMVCPTHPKGILSTQELESAIPDFKWDGGVSGKRLPERLRSMLDSLWEHYMTRFGKEDFDGETADICGRPEGGLDEALSMAGEAYYGLTERDGTPSILGVLRAAMEQATQEDVVASLLRSVLTLPDWDAGYIREKGFSERVVNAARLGI